MLKNKDISMESVDLVRTVHLIVMTFGFSCIQVLLARQWQGCAV
jgi:hypothetical protein